MDAAEIVMGYIHSETAAQCGSSFFEKPLLSRDSQAPDLRPAESPHEGHSQTRPLHFSNQATKGRNRPVPGSRIIP